MFAYFKRAADCPADKVDQSRRARLLLDIQYDELTKPPKRKRDKSTSSDPTSSTSNKATKRYKKNTKSTTNTASTSSSSSSAPTAISKSSLQPSIQPPYPIKLHERVDSILEPFTYLNQYPGWLNI